MSAESLDDVRRASIREWCAEIKSIASELTDKREAAIYIRYAEDIAARASNPNPLG